MSKQIASNSTTTIVAFDSSYMLVAIFHSISEAASLTGTLRQSLIKAAYGEMISVNGRYWRVVPEDFQIEPDDIGELTLFEFDAHIGVDRKIYFSKDMKRGTSILESEYLTIKESINKKYNKNENQTFNQRG